MEHKLTIEGTGAATCGHCSCGLWAELASFHTKNRRAIIRMAHEEHVKLTVNAEALMGAPG
jgi:hypothetical protein